MLAGDPRLTTVRHGSRMEQKYEVRFVKNDPETPPTMEEQIAIAREAARKLGVPTRKASRCTGSAGTRTLARRGPTWSGPGRGLGRSDDAWGPVSRFASTGRWSLATPP
jgi:hypothetical protein